MTLDEAICKEEALAYSFGERYKRLGEPVGDLPELEAEHKQYAEWLKELKAYREAEEEIDRKRKSGQWSEAVVFGMSRALLIMRRHIMEVNADE